MNSGPPNATTPRPSGRSDSPLVLPDDAFNRELVEAVHPRAWRNPDPAGRYNLVVVGGGTAGLVSAAGAAGLGAKVALIERHLLGGDCLNYGCVPSKGVLRAARAVHQVRMAGAFGMDAGGEPPVADFAMAMTRMRRLRAGIAHHDSAERFAGLGVDVFIGEGRFTGPDSLEVNGAQLRFQRAVIATGARAAGLPVPGLAEAGFLTNETVFSLITLPRRLAVIGAGPIGCELAQAFRRFGSEVAVISLDPQLLPREDADAANLLTLQFEREGVKLHLGAKLLRIERRPEGKAVWFNRGQGDERFVADEIMLAVGRTPNVEGLGLDAAGVSFGRGGVAVNDRLQTSNSRIYAAGDICSAYQFTHAADAMARVVLQNAFFFGRKRASALVIPWVTYTDPEIAHVGLSEKEAAARNIPVRTFTVPLAEIDRAVLDGEEIGFARLHVGREDGRILGATAVAGHAGEMIGEIVLAMTQRLKAGALSGAVHPYPTQSEVWRRLGDAWMHTRLTPGVRRWLGRYFAWRR